MQETGSVFANLQAQLQRWAGYEVFSQLLHLDGLEVYLAGGAVRDLLLRPDARARDFDFFVGGPAVEQALQILRGTGRMEATPFGSPRWFPGNDSEVYCDVIPIAWGWFWQP